MQMRGRPLRSRTLNLEEHVLDCVEENAGDSTQRIALADRVHLYETCAADTLFLPFVLFTNEAGFTRAGIVNFHNLHPWQEETSDVIIQSRHQQQFSINVWARIITNSLTGLFVLPGRLSGRNYQYFSRK
ncbi:hypothetical protein ILUMI_23114 [Ignelater luminosus]|uniref:Uncharacterized protein n=1 Tax=Ignelater luminosus TaxID=2038154 RepID=A0A8K0C9D4_IGNLU|nr:hypothetical protein ILUMI_23114 [Ignelater luminosus]